MGILDFFGGSKEKREAKRIRDLAKRSQEKYGDPAMRSKALEGLRDIGTQEAIAALLQRFTAKTEPQITDAEEKDATLGLITSFGEDAVVPVVEFLEHTDSGVSWGVRCLRSLVSEEELVGALAKILDRLSTQYTRDPEKKVVLLKQLEELQGERIASTAVKFLDDPADDVRLAALSILASHRAVSEIGAIAGCLVQAEAPRVKAGAAQVLADLGAPLSSQREEVAAALPHGFALGKDGVVRKS